MGRFGQGLEEANSLLGKSRKPGKPRKSVRTGFRERDQFRLESGRRDGEGREGVEPGLLKVEVLVREEVLQSRKRERPYELAPHYYLLY